MKYYIISFQNMKTGELIEHYECLPTNGDKKIKEVAIKLVENSNLDKEVIRIHIYELKEVIYNGEY